MSTTLSLAQELISRASVSPDDAGCQDLLIQRLERLGFEVQRLPFGEVLNFWARHGTQAPLLAFAGHTDVVPPGDAEQWTSDPFTPTQRDGYLYGRGAADMKGSLAAMITACERFIGTNPKHRGSLAFMITSDEEGPAVNGTVKVMEHLQRRDEHIDWCVIGEPSSSKQVGDVIKNGRRGSLNATLTIHGTQGHVAYPHLADNPLHRFAPALVELTTTQWDQGNDDFPPTTFQISDIHAGVGASNVIPGELQLQCNFRYSTETDEARLRARVAAILDQYDLKYELDWNNSGNPFLTLRDEFVNTVCNAVEEITGIEPQLSTGGGTSDGRFIAPTGTRVLELGPVNATIHQVDECVQLEELDHLSEIYECILGKLLR